MSGEDEWRWTSNVMVVAVVDMRQNNKKRVFLHRRKEKRECQMFPRSRQGCSPISNIFPNRPLTRYAIYCANTKNSESINHHPSLPNQSVWVVRGFIYVRTQRTARNNRHTRLFRTLSNLRGYHFHGRLCTMNACPLFPLSAGSLALSTACL